MRISELLDTTKLLLAVGNGYVKTQDHPAMPYTILNYTDKCTWDRAWGPVTELCRGLIFNRLSGEVLARPFAKFFNYGEYDQDHLDKGLLDLHAPVEVTNKMDGSLGIMYPTSRAYGDRKWAVATRGSFSSNQAIHACTLLWTRYADFEPPPGMTCLFEIIYPENRIVVDYGKTDDLVLLGAVDIETGVAVGPDWISGWAGPQTEVFHASTLADALAMPPRPNAEGLVVHYPSKRLRVKIKQDDYVQLHHLITGLNARVVWERLGAGEEWEDICVALPEEFWPWVRQIATELNEDLDRIMADSLEAFQAIRSELGEDFERKDFALRAVQSEYRPYLFMLLDNREIQGAIWRTLKPSGERTLVHTSEDTA